MAEATKTGPINESSKAPGGTYYFEKETAELVGLMKKTSCQGKEVFLKALISLSTNSLAILEQERMNKSPQNEGEELFIKARFNAEKKLLTFEENGIGEGKTALINRGTAEKKATKSVISALKVCKDLRDVNFFDLGFFTMFAVANKVIMKSKHNGETWCFNWESRTPEGNFTVKQLMADQNFKNGTRITLHLKEDVAEYISREGFQTLLKECSSLYKVKVQSNTVIQGSKEEKSVPQRKAAVASRGEEESECDKDIPVRSQETSNSNTNFKETKATSPTNIPRTAKVVGAMKSPAHQGKLKATKRKSSGKHSLEGSPKVKKGPVSSPDVPVTPSRTHGEAGNEVTETPLKENGSLGRSTPKAPDSGDFPRTSKDLFGSKNSPGNSLQVSDEKPGTLTYAKQHRENKNIDLLTVKVIKCLEKGWLRQKSGGKWFRGKYEIADETDRATLKVFGKHNMALFEKKTNIHIQKASFYDNCINCTRMSTVSKYQGVINVVKNIRKKRRLDEASGTVTLKQMKENYSKTGSSEYKSVSVYIEKVDIVDETTELTVKDRRNSPSSHILVTYGPNALQTFKFEQRFVFYSVTYDPELEKFRATGQQKPKLVSSGKKLEQTSSPSEIPGGNDSN